MIEYPMTFNEFIVQFATEEQCRDYLYQVRWPTGFECPKCGHGKAWNKGEMLYECAKCGRQTSVIAGTIFQGTRKPLRTWFTAIWWITTQRNGASARGLQQVLGIKSYTTAWTWLHKIRSAMVNPRRTKLSGVVEVDEACIGGAEHDGKRGRGTGNKSLVVIAVELPDSEEKNQLGRVRMHVVPDASKESLQTFIAANIENGSTVITDGWTSYASIAENGYAHIVPPKYADEQNPLPHVHMIVSLLKRWLLGTHQGCNGAPKIGIICTENRKT